MKKIIKIFLFLILCIFTGYTSNAQLQILPESSAIALIQKLLGQGVTVSNVSLVADPRATGFFNNISSTALGIDSGIVLSTGKAQSDLPPPDYGLVGDGTNQAQNSDASTGFSLPGDIDLANSISVPVTQTHDACILEFDFVPLGDSIKFNYVFSSEEYTPAYVCDFNDAFAFFISGPGITGLKNIALVPNTLLPVSIFNVNDVPNGGCPNNPAYYIDNRFNRFFTHDGHTTVFTAVAQVQPCQTYHLKLVIADVIDDIFDSGVFLEAKSLSSNAIELNNLTQTDRLGNSYLVEGCSAGSFEIKRPNLSPNPLTVNLSYGGTVINGTDVQLLPTAVTIPGNDTIVIVNVLPVIDGTPEGIETLIIYALAGCAVGSPSDSTTIQIRDYDTLGITPPDTSFICKGAPIQLTASGGYSIYAWDANPTLSSMIIRNPVATPVADFTSYYCTATEGTCNARDSIMLRWKRIYLTSSQGVNCKDASTGEIKVSSRDGWINPVAFSINNGPYQPDSTFSNLPAGTHRVKIKDASGCIDSIDIIVVQLFPDLLISNIALTAASCSGIPDGTVTITASGGNAPYEYSIDGTNFQRVNTFNIAAGNQVVWVKDNNNCTGSQNVIIQLNNTVTLVAGANANICEGKNYQLNPVSNGMSFVWTPAATLSNSSILNPVATPVNTTKYFITATTGICSRTDSVTVFVDPAPAILYVGNDTTIAIRQPLQLFSRDINNSGFTIYNWSPTYGLNLPFNANPIAILDRDITYHVYASTAGGCEAFDTINIKVYEGPELYVPNAFTPNGDGLNDILKVISIGMKEFHFFRLYNRYGQLLFSTTDPNKGWDGTIKGKVQNTGTYVWMAEAVDYRGNLNQRSGTSIIIH